MRVLITVLSDDLLRIEPAPLTGAGGATGGDIPGGNLAATIGPGESYRGWKFRRLRRLGGGVHLLLPKGDPLHPAIDLRGKQR